MPGRTAIVGATSADFDEVEAAMSGALDADDDVDGAGPSARCRPEVVARRFRPRKLLIGGGVVAAGLVKGGAPVEHRRMAVTAGQPQRLRAPGGSGRPGWAGAEQLEIINWTEYIDPPADGEVGTIGRFQRGDRHLGQLQRGRQRQRRVLRQDRSPLKRNQSIDRDM